MRFRYGTALCVIALCCSSAAAQHRPYFPRQFLNTTAPSPSKLTASSSTSTKTVLLLSSVDSTTSSSSTISTALVSPISSTIFSISTTSTSSTSSANSTSNLAILSVIPTASDTLATVSRGSTNIPFALNSTQSPSGPSFTTGSSEAVSLKTSSLPNTTSTNPPSTQAPLSTVSETSSLTSSTNNSTISATNATTSSTTSPTTNSTTAFTTNSTTTSATTSTKTSNSTLATSSVCTSATKTGRGGTLCISYCSTRTFYSFATNATSTVTAFVTVFGNSTSFPSTQFASPSTTLPLQPCIILTPDCFHCKPPPPPPSTILFVTSKTSTVVSFVTAPPVCFSCGSDTSKVSTSSPTTPTTHVTLDPLQVLDKPSKDGSPPSSQVPLRSQGLLVTEFGPISKGSPIDSKKTGNPALTDKPTDSPTPGPQQPPTSSVGSQPSQQQSKVSGQQRPTTPSRGSDASPSSPTVIVNSVSVGLPGSSVVIDGTPVAPEVGSTTVTAGGQVFTVNPSQVIGLGTTINRPIPEGVTSAPAGSPTPTIVNGVSVALDPSFVVVVGGSTFTITPGVSPTSTVLNGVPISIGPGGVGFPGTTVQPASNPTSAPGLGSTVIATLGPGSSVVVIGGSTFTFDPESIPRTTVISGETISIGPGGVGPVSLTATTPADSIPTQVIQTIVTVGPDGRPVTQIITGINQAPTSVVTIGGVPLTEIGSTVIIGSQTFTVGPGASPTTAVINGQTFSIGPGGVGTQSTTIAPPQNIQPLTQVITAGGITFTEIAGPSSSIVIFGSQSFMIGTAGPSMVSVTTPAPIALATQVITAGGITFTEFSSSLVVIGGSTFTIGPGASPTTDVFNGQTISIGPGGIGIGSTTITAPPTNPDPTQVLTTGGITFTQISSSLVVIGSSTFTIGPGATPTTDVFDGQTISIGPGGIGIGSTTIAASPTNPDPTQVVTTEGITFTQISSSLVVIGSSTFTIGPGSTPTTDVFNSQTISLGPNGVGFSTTTLSYLPPSSPSSPAPATTQLITAGGITFAEIGSTLVVIGGRTFTIGHGATPTIDVFDSQGITIGPNGVGFASTTVLYLAGGFTTTTTTTTAQGGSASSSTVATGTPSASPTKNGAGGSRHSYHWQLLVMCITLGVWFLI